MSGERVDDQRFRSSPPPLPIPTTTITTSEHLSSRRVPTAPVVEVDPDQSFLDSASSSPDRHPYSYSHHDHEDEEDRRRRSPSFLHDVQDDFEYGGGGGDTSALDLSTSKVTSEVLAALVAGSGNGGSGKKGLDRNSLSREGEGWLHGVVVDDLDEELGGIDGYDRGALESSSRVSSAMRRDEGDTSFEHDFDGGAIDPDLAALLSPNRLSESISNGKIMVRG